MTTDQIDEAQNLVADMRNVLTVLTGITDEEKLIAAVKEKTPAMMGDWPQLAKLLWSTVPPSPKNPLEWDDQARHVSNLISDLESGLMGMFGAVELAESNHYHKASLHGAVLKCAARSNSTLDKIAQALKEKRQ